MHPHCYLLEVRSPTSAPPLRFLSEGYLEIVWTKLSLQQRVLELGYNYLFTVLATTMPAGGRLPQIRNKLNQQP